jgi:hypothetical protein
MTWVRYSAKMDPFLAGDNSLQGTSAGAYQAMDVMQKAGQKTRKMWNCFFPLA